MPKSLRLVLCGGGTGGHIMPNLAVASALKQQHAGAKFLYIGSRNPMDRQLVEAADLPFKAIFAGKWRRYFSLRNFIDPLFVVIGFVQSFFLLLHFRPQVVLSKGGFASLPVVLAAFVLRRPIILHESDSVMGLANRMVARMATKICVSFPDVAPKSDKVEFTGNPVRSEILKGNRHAGYDLTGFKPHKPVLLVWGGSQGAEQINSLIVDNFESLTSKFQIVHIAGAGKSQNPSTKCQTNSNFQTPNAKPEDSQSYISFEYLGDELRDVYAITDLVVGRAGANSLYELALMKKPNILVPLGNADQQQNALYFEQQGGSIVLREGDDLAELLIALWENRPQREGMVEALGKLARPKAAEEVAGVVESIIDPESSSG